MALSFFGEKVGGETRNWKEFSTSKPEGGVTIRDFEGGDESGEEDISVNDSSGSLDGSDEAVSPRHDLGKSDDGVQETLPAEDVEPHDNDVGRLSACMGTNMCVNQDSAEKEINSDCQARDFQKVQGRGDVSSGTEISCPEVTGLKNDSGLGVSVMLEQLGLSRLEPGNVEVDALGSPEVDAENLEIYASAPMQHSSPNPVSNPISSSIPVPNHHGRKCGLVSFKLKDKLWVPKRRHGSSSKVSRPLA
ncbi:hypothetical protein QVD17_31932 [Tagetes erecta]|uniref:Uncharacterized protein n=1 Tax=Tagetes erecta TaxID=13708 RepID=A0AAD8K5D3_TARER|nr:hypothetical protein QVD17_31932 [Tagetes erecta]